MCIGTLKLDGKTYSIRITNHSRERMQERGVDEKDIINTINSINEKRIIRLRENEREIVIINQKKKLAIVIGFEQQKNQIVVVTVFADNHYQQYRETTKIAV